MGTFFKRLFSEWNKYQEDVKPAPVPPVPAPEPPKPPDPVPVPPAPQPQPVGHVDVWDGEKIPDMMRQFVTGTWSENQLFWALFTCYGSHVGDFSPDVADLGAQCGKIKAWFTAYVAGIGDQLKTNPGMTATIISGDRNDAGGLFVVDNIRNQLLGMGCNQSQIIDGQIYRP